MSTLPGGKLIGVKQLNLVTVLILVGVGFANGLSIFNGVRCSLGPTTVATGALCLMRAAGLLGVPGILCWVLLSHWSILANTGAEKKTNSKARSVFMFFNYGAKGSFKINRALHGATRFSSYALALRVEPSTYIELVKCFSP